MKFYIVIAVTLAFVSVAFSDAIDIPAPLQLAVSQALESGSVFDQAVEDPEEALKRQSSFREALNTIADQCDGKTAESCRGREGESMVYKIIWLALDRREHSKLYEEIEKEIWQAPPPPPGRQGVGPLKYPNPGREQVSEAYRGVWEYFLLWPQPATTNYRDIRQFHHSIVLNSLKQIGSPKTQILYEYCFQYAARVDLQGSKWTSEGAPWISLLNAMAVQHTPDAIQQILDHLNLLKGNQRTYTTVRQHVAGMLLGIDEMWISAYFAGRIPKERTGLSKWRAKRTAWRDVINQMPVDSLKSDDQTVLRQVLDAPEY